MALWHQSHEEQVYGYEDELWDEHPRHVVQGFFAICSHDRSFMIDWLENGTPSYLPHQEDLAAQAIEAFIQRWGGYSYEILRQVLTEGSGRDRLAALFAIGHSSFPDAADTLAPFLKSADALERYAAAILMGLRHDKRSLPVLEAYLLADIPLVEIESAQLGKKRIVQPEADYWFETYRIWVAGVLADLAPPSVISVLRTAFFKHWEADQKKLDGLYRTSDSLLYALGKRGALACLHGISIPDHIRRLSMIQLALGALQADERYERLEEQIYLNQELRQEIVSMCQTHFGLAGEESWQYVRDYGSDYQKRRSFHRKRTS